MTNEEKIEILAEAMDVDPEDLHVEDELKNNDAWDSLSMLSLMAIVAQKCSKKISPQEIQGIVTVQDALNVIG